MAKRNEGKIFEDNWKKSVPESVFLYRPPDAAQSFDYSTKLRFSSHSPCDFLMYDGEILFCLELKTVSGKSISFERTKNDKGIIHLYQIDSLKKLGKYKNVVSGLIIDFRKTDDTYFLNIKDWDNLINSINKKSFNEDDLLKYTIPILIKKEKLRVNYRYNIDFFIKQVKNTLLS